MTTATAERTSIRYNPWAEELYQSSGLYDFLIIKGGRGSYIRKLGLSDHFVVYNYSIDNKATGSHCFFPGFNRNPQSLMSAEGVDILWIEQSETVEQEMELIVPTIRAPGSELWFSWNPLDRLQWCWQRFAVHPRPDDVIVWCN